MILVANCYPKPEIALGVNSKYVTQVAIKHLDFMCSCKQINKQTKHAAGYK